MLKNKIIRQGFLSVLGQVILGIGGGFILFANLGMDAFGVFHSGVANTFNISFGTAVFYESLVILLFAYFIDKTYISFSTVTSLFIAGFTADFTLFLMTNLITNPMPIFIKLVFVLIGSVILASGLNLYVLADLGIGALDIIAEMVTDKSNFEYQKVKMTNDIFFLFLGLILGGHAGIATIFTAFLIGPIVQFIRKRISKPIDIWINKKAI